MGGRATGAGTAHCGLRTGSLYPPAHLLGFEAGIYVHRRRPPRAHGHGGAGIRVTQGRRKHRGGHAGHHRHRRGGPARPGCRVAPALRLPHPRRRSVRRLFQADFRCAGLPGPRALDQADSIVVDPHKHGLQPYGCGSILFRDPAVGRFYKHDSPYTYFTSKELHLGEISLECSRAGATAVALWATQQLLPLTPGGEFAQGLACGRAAALELDRRLRLDPRFEPLTAGAPELDIVVWKLNAASPEQSSHLAHKVFLACATVDLHLALVQLPVAWFEPAGAGTAESAQEYVTCLRSVLMKPEHEAWLDRIWEKLIAACAKEEG